MKNWTIGKRLFLGFSVLIFIILCFGIVNWLQMARVGNSLSVITKSSMPEMQLTDNFEYQIALLRVTNFKHVLYDATQKPEIEKQAVEQEVTIKDLLSKLEQHFNTPEKQALYSKVPPLWESYRSETKKLREASSQNNAETVKGLLTSAGKIGNDLILAVQDCQSFSSKQSDENSRLIESTVASTKRADLIICLSVVVLGLITAWSIGRSIGTILKRLVSELSNGAEQTTAAAGQVSASSQSLAEGASEQAASLEETSSSLEEMASMTKRNAENAQKANDLAKQARQAADKGVVDMQSMNAAMKEIKVSSDDIAKIIKTIDEIAFQTNILALNAAVEAARAGEAGMGFAVVADEVRNLAQRSAQAAKETTSKIEGAISKTAQGVQISGKVAEALNEIVAKARQVDELVAEVSSASREQTQGITQVNTAVGQMDKVTQSNAASAEESAAAAEELNAQAYAMKDSVSQLLKLVGGGGIAQHEKAAETPAKSKLKNAAARKTLPVATNGNGHRHQNGEPTAAVNRAAAPTTITAQQRNQIPMDGDFKDF
jgi:methyl-accepting chemotaxis protein